ncbi:MAG: ATP-dependent DNA helicase RecG [Chloroflexota bacterium]
MINPFETLRKILENELSRGCDNRAVTGGLDKFAPAFENQARSVNADAVAVDEFVNWLKNYSYTPQERRADSIKVIIARLTVLAPPTPLPRYQPPRPPTPPLPPQPIPKPVAESAAQAQQSQPAPVKVQTPPPPKPRYTPKPHTPAPLKRPPLPPEPSGIGLDAPLTVLRGVGAKQAEKLQRLGLHTMRDALKNYPRRYVDYSRLKPINHLEYGEEITIIAKVKHAFTRAVGNGQSQMLRVVLTDDTGEIEAVWFNQPWLKNKLMPGNQVQVSGRVTAYLGRLQLGNPQAEDLDRESLNSGRIVPIHKLTEGISANYMRRWMFEAIGYTAPRVIDPIPESIRGRARLINLSDALLQIHYPDSHEGLTQARKRLAFDEMFYMQLGLRRQRSEWQAVQGQPLSAPDEALSRVIASLPYTLTNAQTRSLGEIRSDLSRSVPMNRLLQGDVGSGKTVVAALAMAVAAGANAQAALMAPTAILADQHHRNISKLLSHLNVALLLGSTPPAEKQAIYDGLRDGSIHVVIGTHALIQEKVEFKNLGFVVVDEQHRFGVAQRAALRGKGGNPHLLVMTATPIPRTLALTVYGDLDVSILDEMPPGRLPIDTRVIYINERERAYAYIRKQIVEGRQAFIICPLVEESDRIEAKAAVEEHERLQKHVFPDLKLDLLHGRMKADEKDEAMEKFRGGETHILVSTSVVEVGVDIQNASVVLIEGANRFGLAQLHQFRGRVGRGAHQSYCLLISESDPNTPDVRLKAMEETQDGFVLAEKDLEIRGPGEFLGTRQSGFGELRMAKLTDLPLIALARKESDTVFAEDPNLQKPEYKLLSERLAEFWKNFEGAGDVS